MIIIPSTLITPSSYFHYSYTLRLQTGQLCQSFRVRLKQLPHQKSGFSVRKKEKIAPIFTSFIHVIITRIHWVSLNKIFKNCPIPKSPSQSDLPTSDGAIE